MKHAWRSCARFHRFKLPHVLKGNGLELIYFRGQFFVISDVVDYRLKQSSLSDAFRQVIGKR